MASKEEYNKELEHYNKRLQHFQKKSSSLSKIRLALFLLCFITAAFFFYSQNALMVVLSITLFFLSFIPLVLYHDSIKAQIEFQRHLIKINKSSLRRIRGKWTDFSDRGEEFIDREHPCSFDLDIFGRGSLFQYLNTALTFYGRRSLSKTITKPCREKKKIKERQEAIEELAGALTWRQEYQAIAMMSENLSRNPEDLLKWCENSELIVSKMYQKLLIRLLPFLTGAVFLLNQTTSFVPISIPLILLLFQFSATFYYGKTLHKIFSSAGKFKEIIKCYSAMLQHIENADFSTPLLLEMKEKLLMKDLKKKASESISTLERLIGFINLRYSSIHFPVNIITLWDLQFYISLEKWKSRAGKHLREWLIALGKYEELSSLAILRYDNPSWCVATIIDEPYCLKAEHTGHPLIHHEERVENDLHLDGAGSIMLITGSNMSGKSTMLRTIGINLILSYAGAPVCAENFECSLMNIYSSMRISDNLEKNISSFYAELIRVKMIIEAAQSGTPMIFFLDEIFRGTNTRDRKTGAVTVLKKLSSDGVMGLVSTHDVELAELEDDTGLKLKNSYFRETYKDNSIHFDYIMREGISDTSDAIYLMRMIGIEI
jgi:ABC-type multidrug transport system fused ATPase/permease subunit